MTPLSCPEANRCEDDCSRFEQQQNTSLKVAAAKCDEYVFGYHHHNPKYRSCSCRNAVDEVPSKLISQVTPLPLPCLPLSYRN